MPEHTSARRLDRIESKRGVEARVEVGQGAKYAVHRLIPTPQRRHAMVCQVDTGRGLSIDLNASEPEGRWRRTRLDTGARQHARFLLSDNCP